MLLVITVRYAITKNIATQLYLPLFYSLFASVPLTTKTALMSIHCAVLVQYEQHFPVQLQ